MAMSVVYATINGQIVSENRGGVISYYVSPPFEKRTIFEPFAG